MNPVEPNLLLSYDNQPANKHSNSVFILLRGTAMLQSHSQQSNENSLFFPRFLLFVEFFYSSNLSLHNFFLSLHLLIRCILSLSLAFFFKKKDVVQLFLEQEECNGRWMHAAYHTSWSFQL